MKEKIQKLFQSDKKMKTIFIIGIIGIVLIFVSSLFSTGKKEEAANTDTFDSEQYINKLEEMSAKSFCYFFEWLPDAYPSFYCYSIYFLRICEDRKLPLYKKLYEMTSDKTELQRILTETFREVSLLSILPSPL